MIRNIDGFFKISYLLTGRRFYGVVRRLKYALYAWASSVLYVRPPVSRYRRICTDLLRIYKNSVSCLLVLAFCLPFFQHGLAEAAGDNGIRIEIKPELLYQGGISELVFHEEDGCRIRDVRFDNRSLVLKKMGSGRYLGLIGAGLREKPGRRKLEVRMSAGGGGSRIIARYVTVKRKKYPEEHLKVPGRMVEFPPDILKRVLDDQKAVKKACSSVTPEIYWEIPFIWPVKSKILSPFGLRRFFNGKPRSPHSGVDLRARQGTPIKAPNNGRVTLVRDCYLSGNTVVIDHGGGLFTLYAHLSRVLVKKGQMVRKGDTMGLAGSSGRATGPHLHWGLSLLGSRVNPAQLMNLLGS